MPGYASPSLLQTPPLELALRAALATGAAIWVVLHAGPVLLQALIPYLETAVQWQDERYRITFSLTHRSAHDKAGADLVLLGRAAVDRLFFIPTSGTVIAMQAGQSLTSSTAIGVLLQPAVMIMAVVLGWPARTRRELLLRAAAGAVAVALWLMVGLPFTLWMYFQDIPLKAFAPGDTTLATPLGRFLLNGGSVAVGTMLGMLAVAGGCRLVPRTTPLAETVQASTQPSACSSVTYHGN